MNETLTLSKFDVDPTAMNVEREWKLWLLQFEDFVELAIDPGINVLNIEHLAKSCPMKTERNVEQSRRSTGGQTFFCYRAEGSKNTCALWLADSGTPQHMTWNKEYFVDFVIFPQPVDVKVRNGDVILAYGWAAVRFEGVVKNHGIKVHAQEEFCTDCVLGKQHRESFHSRKNRSLAPGKLIHVDLCGPMDVAFLGRSKDFAVIKDDFSRYC
ncbi:Retrovirus-related Pol polyprotein from transposon TNT 1-94 [Trichinella papuae]|uniref:Retrovirus-related Pol polyprotein from transposon TNT 1-94 n=1 Tax=Trichinella papuae TaxID=268474 RepID=A0A0V1MV68_9BILA|nr:Retrovirus-related Pol polyprotein from transposon TNT 1-94 [Trichinella papuae]